MIIDICIPTAEGIGLSAKKVILDGFEAFCVSAEKHNSAAFFLLTDFKAICSDGDYSAILLRSGEKLRMSVSSKELIKVLLTVIADGEKGDDSHP